MNKTPMHGVIGYLITPFTTRNSKVDKARLARLTESMVQSGVHGLAPLGSTGCLPYLSDGEREDVLGTVTDIARRRVPVLAGVSAMTTERVIHHARFAEKCGAAAVMITPLSYWKLTADEIFHLYRDVANAISLPIMAYNNPGNSGVDLPLTLVQRISAIDNVTMIKESSGDIRRINQILDALGDRLSVFCGQNFLAFSALTAGARGWCTASAHLVPKLSLKLYELVVVKSDLQRARTLFQRMMPLLDLIVDGGLPRTVAAGLEILGEDVGPLRAPLRPIDKEMKAKLSAILKELHQLDIVRDFQQ